MGFYDSSLVKGYVFDEDLERVLRHEFEKHGAHIFNEKDITTKIGKDVSGIDLCCKYKDFIVVIQCKHKGSACVKDMTNFIYCADVVGEKHQHNIYKIWMCTKPPSTNAVDAANRKNVLVVVGGENEHDIKKVVGIIENLFTSHINGKSIYLPNYENQTMSVSMDISEG